VQQAILARSALAIAIAALLLGACAEQRSQQPPQAAAAPAPDDDAYCQAKGLKPGSDDYVKCRKDRDYVASRQATRESSSQQKLGDFMMDHR
jgi:hypothetical protein